MKLQSYDISPNKLNMVGALVGVVSGVLIASIPFDAYNNSWSLWYGIIFGIISGIFIFTTLIKPGIFFWKIVVWILASGVSWCAAFYTTIYLGSANTDIASLLTLYFGNGEMAGLVLGGIVGVVLLLIPIFIFGRHWSTVWFVIFLVASMLVTLVSNWLALSDMTQRLGISIHIIHPLWQGAILYLVASYLQSHKLTQSAQ